MKEPSLLERRKDLLGKTMRTLLFHLPGKHPAPPNKSAHPEIDKGGFQHQQHFKKLTFCRLVIHNSHKIKDNFKKENNFKKRT